MKTTMEPLETEELKVKGVPESARKLQPEEKQTMMFLKSKTLALKTAQKQATRPEASVRDDFRK